MRLGNKGRKAVYDVMREQLWHWGEMVKRVFEVADKARAVRAGDNNILHA